MGPIILASGSPRRSEILSKAGIEHEVIVPQVDETTVDKEKTKTEVVRLARLKAIYVKEKIKDPTPVLAADTLVTLAGKRLGKPKDAKEAYEMIKSLSGRVHKVITGFCILIDGDMVCGHVTTKVKFRKLSDDEINGYISSGEPFDKAGGYGIQSLASVFVKKIDGCYFNVMGLPISRISSILKRYENTKERDKR